MTYIGTSFYQAINYPIKDIKWFIDEVAKAGGNTIEFFVLRTWQKQYIGVEMPYVKVGTFTDNKYPGIEFPMYDLDRFNERRWRRWERIFKYCAKKNITVIVRIEDFCSFKNSLNKRYYFQYASYQRHILKPIKGSAWFREETWRQREELFKKVVETLEKAGCKYFIVAMNEANMLNGSIDHTKWCINYHNWARKTLKSIGVPRRKMIVSTMFGARELHEKGYKVELHGVNSDIALADKINEWGTKKVFFNGDGIDKFALGRRGDKKSKREPSIEQGEEMGRLIKKHNLFGYCYFNRNTENPLPADIRRAKFDVLKAIIEGYNFVS